MNDANYEELMQEIKEPDIAERARRKRRLAEALAEGTGLLEETQRKLLEHQIEKRLKRQLTTEDSERLKEKLLRLGADRISDVVLDFTPEALSAWLLDPLSV